MSIDDIRTSYSGSNLKEKRETALLTQEELAKKIGVIKQTIISWEKGRATPSFKHLRALRNIFETKETPSK
jgi:DNA-binding XRE family transcriptional regulator